MAPIKGQYVVDSQGRPRAVLMNLKDYRKIMRLIEDMRDLKIIRRQRHEKLIPMQVVHDQLKKNNLA